MKKLKLYLDTSVISHLHQPDALEKQEDTRKLWELIKAGEYDIFLSPVVLFEVGNCSEPKQTTLLDYLGLIQYTELHESDEVIELANKYLKVGILRPKSFDDCQHIAYACVYDCDVLVSWNFKHLVKYQDNIRR